jgi:hypothetical protein
MPKTSKNGKTIGRPEEIDPEDLLTRYKDMKWFLENYWGRVGLEIKRVRRPEDVRLLLNSVPHIEWCKPFKGHAICLIAEKATEASIEEIRVTRRKWKDAAAREQRLWSEYHTITQEAQQAVTAVKSAASQFQEARGTLLFFEIINAIAGKLRVEELTKRSSQLLADIREIQTEKGSLAQTLNAHEAWHARNEVVEFAKNRRYGKTLLNCARAMAGLPEWGWFHSRRTCEAIQVESTPALPYQIVELLTSIIRKMKPLKLGKVEKRLRDELLRPDGDAMLRGYVTPHWNYLQEAIHYCRGVKKSELPYKIMDRFLYHLDRPKTITETELARQNQLV